MLLISIIHQTSNQPPDKDGRSPSPSLDWPCQDNRGTTPSLDGPCLDGRSPPPSLDWPCLDSRGTTPTLDGPCLDGRSPPLSLDWPCLDGKGPPFCKEGHYLKAVLLKGKFTFQNVNENFIGSFKMYLISSILNFKHCCRSI